MKTSKRKVKEFVLELDYRQDIIDAFNSYYDRVEKVVLDIFEDCLKNEKKFTNGVPYVEEHFCEIMCTQYDDFYYNSGDIQDASYEVGGRMIREWAIIIWDDARNKYSEEQKQKVKRDNLAQLETIQELIKSELVGTTKKMALDAIDVYYDMLWSNDEI